MKQIIRVVSYPLPRRLVSNSTVPINVTRRVSTLLGGQAEPKDAGESDSSTNGVSNAEAEGTNRMDGDRTERSTGNKDVKQLVEVQHSEVTGSKHDVNAHPPSATSGGGKDEASIDHYAAAKALTNTKVCAASALFLSFQHCGKERNKATKYRNKNHWHIRPVVGSYCILKYWDKGSVVSSPLTISFSLS